MNINDIGKKIENPELIKAMAAIRADENDETRIAFFTEVVKAALIVPAKFNKEPELDENGRLLLDGEVKVNFTLLTNDRKENVLPCFTDDKALEASPFGDEFKKIVISYKEASDIIIKSNGAIKGMAVNPFAENCFVPVEFMRDVKEKGMPIKGRNTNLKQTKLAPGVKIKLRTPKYQPVEMLDKTSEYLKGREDVTKAYLQMMEEPGKEDKYLIVLETTADEAAILPELIPIMKPHSFGIELAFATADNPLGRKVTEIAEPFYVKID